MNKASTVAKGAAIIAAGTLLSRLLGLIRDRLITTAFGGAYIAGAFRSAYSVPDLLYYLLAGGALSAAFIPIFSGYLVRGEQKDANRVGSSIANLMILILLVGVVAEILYAPYVVRMIAPGYPPGSPVFNLTVSLTRVMCGVVIFTAISGLLTGMLNSYHHFLMPTVVWNSFNLFFILGIVVLGKLHWHGAPLGIYGVGIGVVMGALSMALLQLPLVLKYGFRYLPVIDLSHPGVRRVLLLFVPVMLGLSLGQLNLQFIPNIIASLAGPTAVALIYPANRVVLLPMGIFAVAIATAAFPRMSQQISLGEHLAFRETLTNGLKAIIILIAPCAVSVLLLARPITCLLWGGGAFTMQDIDASAFALSLFIWGLLALSMLQLINRAFFSLQDTITPVIIGVLMVGANILLGILFTLHTRVHFGGTALATSLTTTLATLVLFELLRRRLHGIGGREITLTTVKVLVASLVMGVVVYFVARHLAPTFVYHGMKQVLGPSHSFFSLLAPHIERVKQVVAVQDRLQVPTKRMLLQIGASLFAGFLVYLATLRLLGVKESSLITDRLLRRFRSKPTASA